MFGAVLQSYAVAGMMEEAQDLFQAMDSGELRVNVEPGLACYNSMLLGHVRTKAWDEAIALYETMMTKKIPSTPQTIHGLVLAYFNKGGQSALLTFLKTHRGQKTSIDENGFKLLIRLLLPNVHGKNLEDIRRNLRQLGEQTPELSKHALEVMRSVRRAEVEQKRAQSKNGQQQDGMWHDVLAKLLDLVNEPRSD